MAEDWHLKCMDNCDDKCGYTYFHESLGYYSWLDHLFVSSSISDEVAGFQIFDSGCNNSDHHPIVWSLQNDVLSKNVSYQFRKRVYKQRWDKADVMLYYAATGAYLQAIDVPKHLLHGSSSNNQVEIEEFYAAVVHTSAVCE